jgi:hypothetical protein
MYILIQLFFHSYLYTLSFCFSNNNIKNIIMYVGNYHAQEYVKILNDLNFNIQILHNNNKSQCLKLSELNFQFKPDG